MSNTNAKYEISLVDKYSKKLSAIDKHTQSFEKSVENVGKKLGGVFLGAAILGGMKRMGKEAMNLAVVFEQTEIAFGTFLGDVKAGKNLVRELNAFANVTPMTNTQVLHGAKSLLAYDVAANELIPTLRTLGDIAGGVGLDRLPSLILAYGQVKAATRLTGMELRQFTEAGVPLLDELSKVTGKSIMTIKEELIPAGRIGFDLVKKALKGTTVEGGRFFNMLEKQAKSAGGLVSTLKGKLQLLGATIGKQLLPNQKKLTKSTISLVDKMQDLVKIPLADAVKKERTEVNHLTLKLKDVNTKEEDRKEILKRLNEIHPSIVKGLDAENISMETLNRNVEEYNESAAKRIILANLTDQETKQAVKQSAALQKKIESEDKIRQSLTGERIKELEQGGNLIDLAKKELAWREKVIEANRSQSRGYGGLANAMRSDDLGKRRTEVIRLTEAVNAFKSSSYDLKEAEKNSFDLGKRADRLRELLGLSGYLPIIPGKIEGVGDLETGITKITSAAPKIFNINVGNLIENFDISTTNLTESANEIREQVTRALLEGLADVQPLVR